MPILNPDHLVEQAEKLIVVPAAGPPRQVDLRRAISSAYYAVFHFVLTALADEFVGKLFRSTSRYALVYRSVDHAGLKRLCGEAKNPSSIKFRALLPSEGFGLPLQRFASATYELQEKRHKADYDPRWRLKRLDSALTIDAARTAMHEFGLAPDDVRKTFLTLLLCPPR